MFCGKCGAENTEGITYCTNCGSDLASQTPSERKHTSGSSDTLDSSPTIHQPEIEADSFKAGSFFADRYEILSEGRKGGMGAVYKCKDTKLDEVVALKVIHPGLLSSKQATSRFRQEVALSRRLQHPNIVRVYNLEEWQDKEYFTMEWVEGVTLRDILSKLKKQNEPFSLEEAGNIMTQLSDALHYAHNYTVHRDIKPENILVESEKGTDIPSDLPNLKIKITDFGIAKMLSPSRFTMSSMQMGTPYYMAPEQKTDAGAVDKRADIYAAGVVLFELLTLENTIGLKLPTELNNTLPKEIDSVIKKALEPKPRDRYEDVKELSGALDKIVVPHKKQVEEERRKSEELKRQEVEKKKQAEEQRRKEAEEKERQELEKQKQEQERIRIEAEELKQREAREQEFREREEEARRKKIAKLVKRGNSILEYKGYDAAIKYFKDILEIDAEHKEGKKLLAKAQAEKSEAEKLKRQEIERNEQERIHREAEEKKRQETEQRKEKEEREKVLREREAEARRKKIAKLVKKGNSLQAYKDYDAAITNFKNILEIDVEHKEGKELLAKAQTEKSEAEKLKRQEIERNEKERIHREAEERKEKEEREKWQRERDEKEKRRMMRR